MTYILAGLVGFAGVAAAVLAALSFRLLTHIISRGPAGVSEAYERGDSLRTWWNAAQTSSSLDGPKDCERLAFAGRKSVEFGEVLVEERASVST